MDGAEHSGSSAEWQRRQRRQPATAVRKLRQLIIVFTIALTSEFIFQTRSRQPEDAMCD